MEPTMTSAALATSSPKARRAFTLIELLVVIGILVLLIAILVPMSMKAYRAGERARTQGDLTTITVAIEAFKADFNDIPRPDDAGAAAGSNNGFACLGRFLIGPFGLAGSPNFSNATSPFHPGECYAVGSGTTAVQYVCINPSSSAPPGNDWSVFTFSDGKEGPGIKKPVGGRAYGPYLQPDKFKVQGLALLDRQGNPILYFPGSSGHPNIHQTNGYAMIPGATDRPLYNVGDNELFFRVISGGTLESTNTNSQHSIQMLLGDVNHNGQIDAGETEAATAPFLLWSAGPDGIFGPARTASTDLTPEQVDSKYDDVTNFR